MKTFYYLLVIFIVAVSCSSPKKKNTATDLLNEKIDFLTVISKTETKSPVLIITEKSFNNLNNNQNILYDKYDTLKIKIQPYQFIEVRNKYAYADSLIVKQGDTLLLSFNEDTLIKEIRNKSINLVKRVDYKTIIDTSFSNYLNAFVSNYYTINYKKPLELESDFSKLRLYKMKVNKDNIKNNEDVNNLIQTYDSFVTEYKLKTNTLFNDSRKDVYQDLFLKKRFIDLFMIYKLSKKTEIKDYLSSEPFLSSLKNSSSQYSTLRTLIFDILYKDKADKSRSKIVYNISKIYEDLPNKISNNDLLKKSRIICLEEMIEQGNPLDEVVQLFDRFNLEHSDTDFQNYFQTKHLIDLKKRYNSPTELNLLGSNGVIKSFNDLKNDLKGNVIYIDFWASWCAPCRKVMPASKKLLNEMHRKENVVFIYLSIDKNNRAWKNASKIEGIESYKYNYLILNPDKSKFMHNLKVSKIPRYMIFDINGKLVEDNAPGPTSKSIKDVLLKYKVN